VPTKEHRQKQTQCRKFLTFITQGHSIWFFLRSRKDKRKDVSNARGGGAVPYVSECRDQWAVITASQSAQVGSHTLRRIRKKLKPGGGAHQKEPLQAKQTAERLFRVSQAPKNRTFRYVNTNKYGVKSFNWNSIEAIRSTFIRLQEGFKEASRERTVPVTDQLERNLSWEAKKYSVSQEIPNILLNSRVLLPSSKELAGSTIF
jgi:hypothetical protein